MIKIFLTGDPGVGKTTCVSRIYETLTAYGYKTCGFISKEIREGGVRKGFELISLPDGKREILAHVGIDSPVKIGKYKVNIAGFERLLDEIMEREGCDLYIIDEVGPMEIASNKFLRYIEVILERDEPAVITIHVTLSKQLGKRFKTSKPNILYRITRENRDSMPLIIWRDLNRYLAKKKER